MNKSMHTETDRAFWLIQCVSFTADIEEIINGMIGYLTGNSMSRTYFIKA